MIYRSQLEAKVASYLDLNNAPFLYECSKYPYVTRSKYTPDFFLKNGVIIEAKGWFPPKDRRKLLAVKEQHPELDLRLIFQRNQLLTKKSKTTYGEWATKHGFPWCVYPDIPQSWLENI